MKSHSRLNRRSLGLGGFGQKSFATVEADSETWLDERDEFDRQQRLVQCQRASYKNSARIGSVTLAMGYVGVALYTHFKGIPRMQTKSMLLAMIFTGGMWVGMEQTYLECQMRAAKERAALRGLDAVDEDLYV